MEMEGKGAEDIEMGSGGRRDHVIHAGMAIIIYVDCTMYIELSKKCLILLSRIPKL